MVDWTAHSRSAYEGILARDDDNNDNNNDDTRAVYDGFQPERKEANLKVAVKPFTVHVL